ncbi:MAG: hypothetical protein A2W93_04065 [Bacteroidetes bacterium GWF2_43_63]|nr:MAG: hypothetical protein A2W94_06150 [Bacteroidetes bacterium GWE2_42_42]OFY54357.1 MAG: hypothetical protein A2W93_04065 [Bacteroidetes bacterium GWF2_43_63]HBG69253.1 hypothetical protein [Bacteroidales bacterium]HCB61191.1 hypothetical protein [Bacteroidales bacterium]HCY24111.1 hypothetical protein [Bacteroidales bacterium]
MNQRLGCESGQKYKIFRTVKNGTKNAGRLSNLSAMNAIKEKMIWVLYFCLIASLILAATVTL